MTFYRGLVLFGFIFWITETAFFGWNETAQSGLERIADTISWTAIIWGIIGDVMKNVHIQKFNTTNNNINTKTVEIKEAHLKGGKNGSKKA